MWKLLGAEAPGEVTLNALAGDADAALAAVRAGFSCVKVKVGLADDLERIAAVRAAVGGDVAMRIDANGAWSVEQAVAALAELSQFGIELCEEPVHGLDGIVRVATASPIPVALDESGELSGAFDQRVCDAVCLKIARCGGITGLVDAAARARAAGYRVYLASTLDGPLGIAAALHAAAVVRPELPCGLATLSLFERVHPLATVGGSAFPRSGRGSATASSSGTAEYLTLRVVGKRPLSGRFGLLPSDQGGNGCRRFEVDSVAGLGDDVELGLRDLAHH